MNNIILKDYKELTGTIHFLLEYNISFFPRVIMRFFLKYYSNIC